MADGKQPPYPFPHSIANTVPEKKIFPGDTSDWFQPSPVTKKKSGPIFNILTNNKPPTLTAKKPEVAPVSLKTESSEQKAEKPKTGNN
mmetsp:Transcript_17393/g.17119  ORF Transcript_17393/g.17119 Transcript_17393/m.17119 type:complete len:88 (-) Transcript_17393:275-538(-)